MASPNRRSRSPLRVCATALVGPTPSWPVHGKSRVSNGAKMWELLQLAMEDSDYFDEWHSLVACDRERYK
eukprot:9908765-Karenia_brevis.AAC.1